MIVRKKYFFFNNERGFYLRLGSVQKCVTTFFDPTNKNFTFMFEIGFRKNK